MAKSRVNRKEALPRRMSTTAAWTSDTRQKKNRGFRIRKPSNVMHEGGTPNVEVSVTGGIRRRNPVFPGCDYSANVGTNCHAVGRRRTARNSIVTEVAETGGSNAAGAAAVTDGT